MKYVFLICRVYRDYIRWAFGPYVAYQHCELAVIAWAAGGLVLLFAWVGFLIGAIPFHMVFVYTLVIPAPVYAIHAITFLIWSLEDRE